MYLLVNALPWLQNQPPEERYAAQLEQLTGMGFPNREANLQGQFPTMAYLTYYCLPVLLENWSC
jgi:hypothetical protein